MYAFETRNLDLAEIRTPGDPTRDVRAAFPLHRETGAASTAVVYFELEPGMHLGSHVDSAEEVLVVLEGEVEATVGGRRARVGAGGIVLIPSMVPHDVANVGGVTARVAGVFSANTTVSVFEQPFSVMGMEPTRVTGTPMPEAAMPAAAAVA
jgi:quercetin dioxygenase-like cupin family protein